MDHKALIFDIKRDCSEDGPGIRTTVFFKGCPLNCSWCQNPEGISSSRELSYHARDCRPEKCRTSCVNACPESSLRREGDQIAINRTTCNQCERCVTACPTQALECTGNWFTLDELLYRVAIDRPFYDCTGGGVTLSGGEATQQMDFAGQFLQALKEEGIHTALETSGFFNYRRFRSQLLPYLDLIYFDLKLINDGESRHHTGQSNRPILENFAKLVSEAEIPVIPRIPLIPGITTTPENLAGIAHFLESQGISAATLLPYNPLWCDKSVKIGRPPTYARNSFMTPQEQEQCIHNFRTTYSQRRVYHAD